MSPSARSTCRPANEAAAKVEPANFTVLRAKRDILRRSSIGGMFTHRTATPGRAGSNDGYGLDARLSFYQNVRFDAYLAGTQDRRPRRRQLSYRGFFDYNADRYGVQVERLVVEPNFLPEIGFVRRTDMRRNFVQARYSPRPTSMPQPAQDHDAGEPQLPDQQSEPARHARAAWDCSRPSSPTATSRA